MKHRFDSYTANQAKRIDMEIYDTPQKLQDPQIRAEVVLQEQREYKLVGSQRRVPGHTMFSLNTKTGEIKPAPMICQSVVTVYGTVEHNRRIDLEPNCIYRQALNKKNFIKRLVREGIIQLKNT